MFLGPLVGETLITQATITVKEKRLKATQEQIIPHLVAYIDGLAFQARNKLNINGRNVTVNISEGVNGEGEIEQILVDSSPNL